MADRKRNRAAAEGGGGASIASTSGKRDEKGENEASGLVGKQRRFAFKRLEERFEGVGVAAYRRRAAWSAAAGGGGGGSGSGIGSTGGGGREHEDDGGRERGSSHRGRGTHTLTSLEHWRELCTAEDFLRVYGVVRHLVTTLPLLLHYKETVIESLLNALRKGRAAAHSIPALAAVTCAVFRDLRSEAMPHWEALCAAVTKLVIGGIGRDDEMTHTMTTTSTAVATMTTKHTNTSRMRTGATTVDADGDGIGQTEPELLEHALGCLSACCRWMMKELVTDLTRLLTPTRTLRTARKMPHVRRLTCQAIGFVFMDQRARQAGARALVDTVVNDAVACMRSSARSDRETIVGIIEGSGVLLATAVLAPKRRLHSCAMPLLDALLSKHHEETEKDDDDTDGNEGDTCRNASEVSPDIHQLYWDIARAAWTYTISHVERGSNDAENMWNAIVNHADAIIRDDLASRAARAEEAGRGVRSGGDQDEGNVLRAKREMKKKRNEILKLFATCPEEFVASSAALMPFLEQALQCAAAEACAAESNKDSLVVEFRELACRLVATALRSDAFDEESIADAFADTMASATHNLLFTLCQELVDSAEACTKAGIHRHHSFFSAILRGFEAQQQRGEDGHVNRGDGEYTSSVVVCTIHELQTNLGVNLGDLTSMPTLCALIQKSTEAWKAVAKTKTTRATRTTKRRTRANIENTRVVATPSDATETHGNDDGGQDDDDEMMTRSLDVSCAAVALLPLADVGSDVTAGVRADVSAWIASSSQKGKPMTVPHGMCNRMLGLRAISWRTHLVTCRAQNQWEDVNTCVADILAESVHDADNVVVVETIEAVAAALTLIHADSKTSTTVDFSASALADRFTDLSKALSSTDHRIRQAALQIINSHEHVHVEARGYDTSTSSLNHTTGAPPTEAFEFFQGWADNVEGVQYSPRTSRTAQMVVTNLENMVEYRKLPIDLYAPVAQCLVGGLAIPFSQLWPHVSQALSSMLNSRPKLVWPVLQTAMATMQAQCITEWRRVAEGDDSKSSFFPVSSSSSSAVAISTRPSSFSGKFQEKMTDSHTILLQLIHALEKCPGTIVQYEAEVFALFAAFSNTFSTTGCTVSSMVSRSAGDANSGTHVGSGDGYLSGMHVASSYAHPPSGTHAWRACLCAWMRAFASVKRPTNLDQYDVLMQMGMRNLISADENVQAASFLLLRAFGAEHMDKYAHVMEKIANTSLIRQAITAFPLHHEYTDDENVDGCSGGVEATTKSKKKKQKTSTKDDKAGSLNTLRPEHRSAIVPLLIRLLWPKMRKRSGRLAGKGASGSARTAIFLYLAGLDTHELVPFIGLMIAPVLEHFTVPVANEIRVWDDLSLSDREAWKRKGVTLSSSVPHRKCMGFLNSFADMLSYMAVHVVPYLHLLLPLVLHFLETATNAVHGRSDNDNENDDTTNLLSSKTEIEEAREIRGACLDILSKLFERFPGFEYDYDAYWQPFLQSVHVLLPRVTNEAISASNPPALVRCIAALALSEELMPRLCDRNTGFPLSLLDTLLPIVGRTPPANPSRKVVLSALKNLIALADESDDEHLKKKWRRILDDYATAISSQMESFLQSGGRRTDHIEDNGTPVTRDFSPSQTLTLLDLRDEISIIIGLTEHTADRSSIVRMFRALLPSFASLSRGNKILKDARVQHVLSLALNALRVMFLGNVVKDNSNNNNNNVMATVDDVSSNTTGMQVEEYRDVARAFVESAAPLLNRALPTSLRAEFVDSIRVALQNSGVEKAYVAGDALVSLNAYSTSNLDELDYDTRLAAYRRMQSVVAEAGLSGAKAVFWQSLFDLKSDDLAIQNAAAQAIGSCVDAAAREDFANEDLSKWIHQTVFANAKAGISRSTNQAARGEHLMLLRHLVRAFPKRHVELLKLSDTDTEQDFFYNVCHIQMHRRSRALIRLTHSFEEGQLSAAATMTEVITPLLLAMLGDVLEKSGKQQAQLDKEAGLGDTIVSTMHAFAAQLNWDGFHALFVQVLRLLRRYTEIPKLLVRVTCEVLDAFHFEDATDKQMIFEVMERRILPELNKLLMVESEVIRAPIASAIIKVLKILPETCLQVELPRVLHGLANMLSSRSLDARNLARRVLCDVSRDLGAEYLVLVLEALKTTLTRGFQVHVLGYTLHSILEHVLPDADPRSTTTCIGSIVSLLENDLFDAPAEERNVEKIAASTKEAKTSKSPVCFELLASHIDFPDGMDSLLEPILSRTAATSAVTRNKLTKLTQMLVKGISRNPRATHASVLRYTRDLLDENVQQKVGTASLLESSSKISDVTEDRREELGRNLIVEFALDLCLHGLQGDVLLFEEKDDEELMKGGRNRNRTNADAMSSSPPDSDEEEATPSEDFMSTLAKRFVMCLKSDSSRVAASSMKCLGKLVRGKSLAVDTQGATIIAAKAVSFICKYGKTSPESAVVVESYKLLALTLGHSEATISQRDLRRIVANAFIDIESPSSCGSSFSLLSVLLRLRLDIPELRALMEDRVTRTLVVCQDKNVQRLASKALLQYALDFPLGKKSLDRLLAYYIKNLEYSRPSGRLAVLDMLMQIVKKFPVQLVAAYASTLFVPLARTTVVDDDPECRNIAAESLKVLFERSPPATLETLMQYAITWHGPSMKPILRITAAQVLCIALDTLGRGFKYRTESLNRLVSLVEAAVPPSPLPGSEEDDMEANGHGGINDDEEEERLVVGNGPAARAPEGGDWVEVYHNLLLYEKLCLQFENVIEGIDSREIGMLCRCMAHKHLWIRKVSSRIIYATLSMWAQRQDDKRFREWHEELQDICDAACGLFQSRVTDAQAGLEATRIMAFIFQRSLASEASQKQVAAVARKVLSSEATPEQAIAVLTWIGSLNGPLVSSTTSTILIPELMMGLVRITGRANVSHEVQSLAKEVLQHVRDTIGRERFANAHQAAVRAIDERAQAARKKRSIEKVLNPERSAKKKLKRSQKRTAHRKKKVEEMRRQRGNQ